ncbi:MAG: thiamine phosphate synthase [Myxococcota bacterium]
MSVTTPNQRRIVDVDWSVYVILDPRVVPEDKSLLEVAEAAIQGGAGVLQLRDKGSDGRQLVERARSLARLCRQHSAHFVVNDRLDVAMAAGADGVHLGPTDISVRDARRVAPGLIIGGSAGTPELARDYLDAGVDYLGVGAMYEARASKPDASAPRGPAAMAKIRELTDIPLIGIGGIDAGNAAAVIEAGASGVAVIREVVKARDPRAATADLASVVKTTLSSR